MALTQTSARWRNDDGSEAAATWKAATNTDITLARSQLDVPIRLRCLMTTDAAMTGGLGIQLSYSLNGGAYTSVNATSAVAQSIASAFVANAAVTTQQISAGGTFATGEFDSNNGLVSCFNVPSAPIGAISELECSFKLLAANLAVGDTVDFRVLTSAATVSAWTNTPRVTIIESPTPRQSASATASGTGTSVTINKQTGTANLDHMEATVAFQGGTGVTITATGWTLVERRDSTTVIGIATYRKTAGASEAAETWTLSGSQQWVSACESYSLGSGSTPEVDTSNGQANASSTNIAAPQVTTAVVDELLRFSGAVAAGQAGGITAPTGMTEMADVQTGTGAGGTAAAKTLYLMGGTLTNSFQPMQEGGTAPTDAFFATGTGWLSAANANATMAELRPNVIRARTVYAATVVPTTITTGANANAFRSPVAYSGSFASGNWTLSASMRSSVAQPSTTRLRWRVFASTDATGATGIRELTSAVQLTNAIATTTTANATMTVTWAAPAITLVGEYLFFAVANEMVALSGTGNTRDTQFRQNSTSAITTTTFTPALNLALEVAQEYRAALGATGTRTAVAATNAAVSVASLIALRAPVITLQKVVRVGMVGISGEK